MNPIVKNILAVIAAALVGGCVNMGIVMISGKVIPPPPGTDLSTNEGLAAAIPLFEPRHFIMPFLAHALGTLVGAMVAVRLAATRKMNLALLIGLLNLAGGFGAVWMFPAPLWFEATDLLLAYLPMAYLGWKLMAPKTNPS